MTEQGRPSDAFVRGLDLARQAKAEGHRRRGRGGNGISNTTTSAAVLAALTGASVEEVAGRGGGLTDRGFAAKKRVLRQALALHHPDPGDPVAVLAAVGGLDLAAMTGLFLGCAHEGLAAAVDGYISIVAALCAVRLCPRVRDYLFLSHASYEIGYRLAAPGAGAGAVPAAGHAPGRGQRLSPCCSGYCRGPARCWTGWPPSRKRPLRTNIWPPSGRGTHLRWTNHENSASGRQQSGKKHAGPATRQLADGGPMIWATLEPRDGEDRAIVRRHLAEREGWGFQTLERGRELPRGLAAVPPESAVLFDSVTACLACQMFSGPSPDAAAPERTAEELLAVSRRVRHLVCVCDEIWRDGVTYETWTETYRRGLAAVCRALAAEFDAVAELSAGCVRMWKGELPDA